MFKHIVKYLRKNILLLAIIILFTFNFIILCSMENTLFSLGILVKSLENKIEIHEIQKRNEIKDIHDFLKTALKNTKTNLEMIVGLQNTLKKLRNIITENEKKFHKIDNKEINKIKKANVRILNLTEGRAGSGTYIKYRGRFFILSCAHLIDYDSRIDEFEDRMYVQLDDKTYYPLILEKIDKELDLALFKVKFRHNFPYLELSDVEPKKGSEVLAVGNPDGLRDIVTDGIIGDIDEERYLFTNLIFFGNSGGALIYRNKVIGVVTQIRTYINFPTVFMNYGYAVNLKTIKEFLYYIKD